MADPDDIEQQRALLQAYRRSLAISLEQLAQHSSAFAPPALLNNIHEARGQIQRIKTYLRQQGVEVEDHRVDSQDAREPLPHQAARSFQRVPRLVGAVLVLVLVLGAGAWQLLPALLRFVPAAPTAIITNTPEPVRSIATPSPPSTSPDPQNWQSLVRVTSAAFLDGNTCWLGRELPESIHPDGDPATVQPQISQIQNSRRVPMFSASNAITIPIQITNILKQGEVIALAPKMTVTVRVAQETREHIDVLTTCGGMGLGTFRNFSGISLLQTANVEQYKLSIDAAGDYFFAEPGHFEFFQVPLICSSPGIYSVHFELPYTYANQPGVITFNAPDIVCPKSYTVWLVEAKDQPLRQKTSYQWTGSGYEQIP